MCICVYMCIYVYICVYMCTCVYTYVYMCIGPNSVLIKVAGGKSIYTGELNQF